MAQLEEIKKQLSELSIVDAAELVKQLEEDWGVKAAAGAAVMAAPAAGGAAGGQADAAEKTEFTVMLASIGDKKIQVIKEVRALTGLGLKEAKELVEAAPKAIKEGIPKEQAQEMKSKLEAQGATVELA